MEPSKSFENLQSDLKQRFLSHWDTIQDWFQEKQKLTPGAITSSVDLRVCDFKISPVDANLFPAGWNNLCTEDRVEASLLFKEQFSQRFGKDLKTIHIYPENHTSNKFYWENIRVLKKILESAGYQVSVGSIDFPLFGEGEESNHSVNATQISTQSGEKVEVHKTWIQDKTLQTSKGTPSFILINNDFSSGIPSGLESTSQPMCPPICMGWFRRSKHHHSLKYQEVLEEFSELISMDPFLAEAATSLVKDVDFREKAGLDTLAEEAQKLLDRLQKDYQARGIKKEPLVFVKADSGTYGMGILTVKSGEQLAQLGRKARNKMDVIKNKLKTRQVIIQEGIPTALMSEDKAPAEPVIYLTGLDLAGGFLRTNPERGDEENLNVRGMVFKKLCMAELRRQPQKSRSEEVVYGTIARLSALAMGLEIKESLNLLSSSCLDSRDS